MAALQRLIDELLGIDVASETLRTHRKEAKKSEEKQKEKDKNINTQEPSGKRDYLAEVRQFVSNVRAQAQKEMMDELEREEVYEQRPVTAEAVLARAQLYRRSQLETEYARRKEERLRAREYRERQAALYVELQRASLNNKKTIQAAKVIFQFFFPHFYRLCSHNNM